MADISLRDQFAIAAMQGLLADGWMKDQKNIAELAYQQADAMLAERDKMHGRLNKIKGLAQNLLNYSDEISPSKTADLILGLIEGYGEQA
ncbi:hypothetical protein [Acinetobacter guillouiae]|uniref:Uncharacterized protein n=1 Tax=Acinetobacter guillouiae NIPH 991 TaxID=1217656 RepID=N8WX05_ACIGI|nr:hypothetical protein [Acinetobacter guillouiae]ENV16486.1 hypothetical protein F964_03421 [Acinetobacter guillouiae NIPH 991]